jgi:hypothetical protein
MSASLIGRLGSSTFRLSTTCSVDVAHGIALLFGIGTKALVWDFFSQEVQAWWSIFFSSSFFADLKVRFFFPRPRMPSRINAAFIEVQHPNLQISTTTPADYPIFRYKPSDARSLRECSTGAYSLIDFVRSELHPNEADKLYSGLH